MNIIFQVVSAIVMFFVTYKYFEYHPEYSDMLSSDANLLPYFINIAIIGGLIYLWHKYNDNAKNIFFGRKISVIYMFLISVFITANNLFLSSNIFPNKGQGGLPDVVTPFNIVTAQFGLISKAGYILFALIILLLVGYVLGDRVIQMMKLKETIELPHVIKSIIIGWVVFMQILFLLGIFQLLKPYILWVVVVLILISHYKSLLELWNKFFMDYYVIKLNVFAMIALSFLYFFISMNFIEIIRPIPIGWDDMNVYINIPNLISQYGALVKWSYLNFHLIESLGFIMFNWTTVALSIAWMAGILSVIAFIVLLRYVSNTNIAIILTTIWYSIPGVVFQSSKDMKTDFPMLAFLIIAFYLYINFIKSRKWQYVFLIGLVLGGALLAKVTALTVIVLMFPLILFVYFRWQGVLAGVGMMMLLIAKANLFAYGQTIIPDGFLQGFMILGLGMVIIGLGWIFLDKFNIPKLKEFIWYFIGLYLGAVITITFNAGYMIYNNIPIDLQTLLNNPATHSSTQEPITKFDITKLPKELALPKEANEVKATGGYEELGRYIGFHKSCEDDQYSFKCIWDKHITIPWNITMNIYSKGQYLDITPFFYIVGIIMFIWVIYLYITRKENELKDDIIMQDLAIVAIMYTIITTIFLMFFSSAIHWYSIFFYMSTLFIIAIGWRYIKENNFHKVFTYSLLILIGVLLVSDTAYRVKRGPHPYFIGYLAGAYSGESKEMFPGDTAVNKLLPGYLGAAKIVNQIDLYSNVMYRIGTFIIYFIEKNDTKNIVQDSLIDEFIKLNYDNDYMKTYQRLKFFNTKIMIVDLFTPTIDRTPDKSLSKKFVRLVNPENLCITIMKQENKTQQETVDNCKSILDKLQYGAYASYIDRTKKGFIDYFIEAKTIKILSFDPGHGLLLIQLL